ncbi:MAG: hypothetical protein ACD_4C00389G0001, partial [uncultured bacterium (gcode 4)]
LPAIRKATARITISHKIPSFKAWWKTQCYPDVPCTNIKNVSIQEKKEIINKTDLPKKLFQIINGSRLVKRKPVSRPKILQAIIDNCIKNNLPIPIFQYWWMGARNVPWRFEDSCFQNLNNTFQEIKKIYEPGVSLSLIFCDTHMEINGFWKAHRNSYLKELIPMAKLYWWKIYRFSELMKKSPTVFHREVLEKVNNFPMPEEIQSKLYNSASKKPIRDDYENAAREYWTANILEREIIEHNFYNHVFLTFNEPLDDIIFSDKLCILHWFPIKKWITDKPWFREE